MILQLYMPTSEYKDEEVEEMYDKIKEILKRMGKARQTPLYWGIATVWLGKYHTKSSLDHMAKEEITYVKCSLFFMEKIK